MSITDPLLATRSKGHATFSSPKVSLSSHMATGDSWLSHTHIILTASPTTIQPLNPISSHMLHCIPMHREINLNKRQVSAYTTCSWHAPLKHSSTEMLILGLHSIVVSPRLGSFCLDPRKEEIGYARSLRNVSPRTLVESRRI